MNKFVKKIKIKFFESWKESMGFTWRVILLRVILFLIGILVVLVLMLFFSIFFAFNLKLLGGILALLLLFVILFLLQIFLFFIYPSMFLKNRKAVSSLKDSFYFVKKNFSYTFVIWLLTMLIIFVTSIVLNVPENLFKFIGVFYFTYVFVRTIVGFFIRVYVELVKFYAYNLKH